MQQQINTFEEFFPLVDRNGVYLCEDLHTSYWPEYGGGYCEPGTFIEYSKSFIDYIHAWHSRQMDRLEVTELTRTVHSLHYSNSILVIEKRPTEKPYHLKTGKKVIPGFRKSCLSQLMGWLRQINARLTGRAA